MKLLDQNKDQKEEKPPVDPRTIRAKETSRILDKLQQMDNLHPLNSDQWLATYKRLQKIHKKWKNKAGL